MTHFRYTADQRKKVLKTFMDTIIRLEDDIVTALYKDFKKPAFESVITETSYVITDLKHTISNLSKFAKPVRVSANLLNFPATDYIYSEPYGKVLVIAPWNYPFQLAMCPLVAAVSAGNSVVLKPSELTPHTSAILSKIIKEVFQQEQVSVEEGGVEKSEELLNKRWDYIFFTGSVEVGKIVAKAAARNLTPVTLELGGKSPCIVDQSANIALAAKRIVWGKFINAGQTCIAPDYMLVHHSVKNELILCLRQEITKAYGHNPAASPDFARIINTKNWERLVSYMQQQTILFGGETNQQDCFIAPTLIDEPSMESPLMQHEIFGPLLPIISYTDEKDLDTIIGRYEKPLSLYVFTERKEFADRIIADFSFGGGCINDTLMHISNRHLPFGGVGHSGMGAYHGKNSFDTFSHKKAITKKATWLDIPLRYAPYKEKLAKIKRLLKWL